MLWWWTGPILYHIICCNSKASSQVFELQQGKDWCTPIVNAELEWKHSWRPKTYPLTAVNNTSRGRILLPLCNLKALQLKGQDAFPGPCQVVVHCLRCWNTALTSATVCAFPLINLSSQLSVCAVWSLIVISLIRILVLLLESSFVRAGK